MNPARNQKRFHWAGTVVGEAEEGWHAGKQGRNRLLAGSRSRHRLEGPGWRSCQPGNGAKREQDKVQSFGPEVAGDRAQDTEKGILNPRWEGQAENAERQGV